MPVSSKMSMPFVAKPKRHRIGRESYGKADCPCHKPANGHNFGKQLVCVNRHPVELTGLVAYCGCTYKEQQRRPTICKLPKGDTRFEEDTSEPSKSI